MIVDDGLYETEMMEIKKYENLINPGSAYLRIMQYYSEEKTFNRFPNKIEVWENFICKYFSESVEMNIRVFDKDNLFYEISK
jgi:hypothetical protein